MNQKNTDIHEPDGMIFKGRTAGHGDRQNSIRKRDGVVFRGGPMGYVDGNGNIHRPDGIIFRGEEVGRVKGDAAHAKDGVIFTGEKWGYVDEKGNIRQRDGMIFKGRVIGKMRGRNKEAALGFFVLRFREMEDRFKKLDQTVRCAENKTAFLGKVKYMLDYVPKADALGDFDGLIHQLNGLEQEILDQFSQNRRKKEAIASRAETLSSSTDWKAAGEEYRELREKWKQVRSAGKEHEGRLWQRFRSAQDKFYRRRTDYFQKAQKQRSENLGRKRDLCSAAEALSGSTDFRVSTTRVKDLQATWKSIGPVPREENRPLWDRFRKACDRVFENARKDRERRKARWEEQNRQRMENLRRKERLCAMAESLSHTRDTGSATSRIKELQGVWKSIGPVPKEEADVIWQRFRRACDRVFENAREQWRKRTEEREQKQAAWRERTEEALERKRAQVDRLEGSIAHDESNIDRWESTIAGLHPGGRADEIHDSLEIKISDVESRIRSKKDRIRDLESSIRDIERKLYG